MHTQVMSGAVSWSPSYLISSSCSKRKNRILPTSNPTTQIMAEKADMRSGKDYQFSRSLLALSKLGDLLKTTCSQLCFEKQKNKAVY